MSVYHVVANGRVVREIVIPDPEMPDDVELIDRAIAALKTRRAETTGAATAPEDS